MVTREELVSQGLLSVKDAAAFLAISRTTLWTMMDDGTLPFVHAGPLRARKLPKAALIKWASEHVVGA